MKASTKLLRGQGNQPNEAPKQRSQPQASQKSQQAAMQRLATPKRVPEQSQASNEVGLWTADLNRRRSSANFESEPSLDQTKSPSQTPIRQRFSGTTSTSQHEIRRNRQPITKPQKNRIEFGFTASTPVAESDNKSELQESAPEPLQASSILRSVASEPALPSCFKDLKSPTKGRQTPQSPLSNGADEGRGAPNATVAKWEQALSKYAAKTEYTGSEVGDLGSAPVQGHGGLSARTANSSLVAAVVFDQPQAVQELRKRVRPGSVDPGLPRSLSELQLQPDCAGLPTNILHRDGKRILQSRAAQQQLHLFEQGTPRGDRDEAELTSTEKSQIRFLRKPVPAATTAQVNDSDIDPQASKIWGGTAGKPSASSSTKTLRIVGTSSEALRNCISEPATPRGEQAAPITPRPARQTYHLEANPLGNDVSTEASEGVKAFREKFQDFAGRRTWQQAQTRAKKQLETAAKSQADIVIHGGHGTAKSEKNESQLKELFDGSAGHPTWVRQERLEATKSQTVPPTFLSVVDTVVFGKDLDGSGEDSVFTKDFTSKFQGAAGFASWEDKGAKHIVREGQQFWKKQYPTARVRKAFASESDIPGKEEYYNQFCDRAGGRTWARPAEASRAGLGVKAINGAPVSTPDILSPTPAATFAPPPRPTVEQGGGAPWERTTSAAPRPHSSVDQRAAGVATQRQQLHRYRALPKDLPSDAAGWRSPSTATREVSIIAHAC